VLCASISFAATGSKSSDAYSDNQKLYELPEPDSSRYVSTDLRFTQKTEVSTTAKVLSSGTGNGLIGDTICPGSVTVKSTSSGKWADNDFYAKVTYYPPCAPPSSSANPTDIPIRFHNSDYNTLINWASPPDSICHDYDSCYGHEGTLTNRRINIFQGYSDTYSNRLGRVSYTCAGSNSLSVTGAGSLPVQQATGGTSFSRTRTVNLNQVGTYTFTDMMSVEGCAAVVRYPACPGTSFEDERIFSRTSASLTSAPEYKKTTTNKFTIKVENRQNSITFGPTTPSSPVTIPNTTSSTLVGIAVTNNGGASVQITSVTSSNSLVKVVPFDNSLCGGLMPSSIAAICQAGGGGFNTTIVKGASRNVWVYLSAPGASAPGTYTTDLTFTHEAQTEVCDSKIDSSSFTLNLGSGPGDTVRCEITPDQVDIRHKQLQYFTVQCFDSTNAVVPCVGNDWTINGLSYRILHPSDSDVWAGSDSADGSTGQLTYTTGLVSCNSNLTVIPANETLTIDPQSANLKLNNTQPFTATCTETANGSTIDCLGNEWNADGLLIGQLSNSTINYTLYTATVDNITTELLAVAWGLGTDEQRPWDDATIRVGTGGNGDNGDDDEKKGKSKYCIIDPIQDTFYTGWRSWIMYCLDPGNGEPTSCEKTVEWYWNGEKQDSYQIGGGYGTGFLLQGTGVNTLIAYTDKDAGEKCELEFNSTEYDCVLYS
jgi:hypothetical protein